MSSNCDGNCSVCCCSKSDKFKSCSILVKTPQKTCKSSGKFGGTPITQGFGQSYTILTKMPPKPEERGASTTPVLEKNSTKLKKKSSKVTRKSVQNGRGSAGGETQRYSETAIRKTTPDKIQSSINNSNEGYTALNENGRRSIYSDRIINSRGSRVDRSDLSNSYVNPTGSRQTVTQMSNSNKTVNRTGTQLDITNNPSPYYNNGCPPNCQCKNNRRSLKNIPYLTKNGIPLTMDYNNSDQDTTNFHYHKTNQDPSVFRNNYSQNRNPTNRSSINYPNQNPPQNGSQISMSPQTPRNGMTNDYRKSFQNYIPYCDATEYCYLVPTQDSQRCVPITDSLTNSSCQYQCNIHGPGTNSQSNLLSPNRGRRSSDKTTDTITSPMTNSKSSPYLDVIEEEIENEDYSSYNNATNHVNPAAQNRNSKDSTPTFNSNDNSSVESDRSFIANPSPAILKTLEQSFAEFLNIVFDNILELVQKNVDDIMRQHCSKLVEKMEALSSKLDGYDNKIDKVYDGLSEKISHQNEQILQQFHLLFQNLNEKVYQFSETSKETLKIASFYKDKESQDDMRKKKSSKEVLNSLKENQIKVEEGNKNIISSSDVDPVSDSTDQLETSVTTHDGKDEIFATENNVSNVAGNTTIDNDEVNLSGSTENDYKIRRCCYNEIINHNGLPRTSNSNNSKLETSLANDKEIDSPSSSEHKDNNYDTSGYATEPEDNGATNGWFGRRKSQKKIKKQQTKNSKPASTVPAKSEENTSISNDKNGKNNQKKRLMNSSGRSVDQRSTPSSSTLLSRL